ncbi:succinyl-diaminopimelate desuccinylase [Tessaracoccus caeni]|uniref:succinyl-diaminopimelate desuccinylase n=1 Tax=Tessaracoccus caeni TaxID=3031239 RepID=UPI0023DBADD4|nr:succinyl-diaminopimelate desuccinylase [Tessaracoccus caeni]MDF1487652.1 succinyl-diaminopimelate desuccinylase [Tessaracoccus caeni]
MSLDVEAGLVALLQQIVDIESVSGNERELADAVELTLRSHPHLDVERDGDCVVARTQLGRGERVVIAGHLDTVPVADNLPSSLEEHAEGLRVVGRGTCDMKGGVAVMLALATELTAPNRDLTWIFYDHEEVDAFRNGLRRLSVNRPELLAADFAVLMEPTSAEIEGGCQGTCRIAIAAEGKAAHSARAWMGTNAIHGLGDVLRRLEEYQPAQVEVDGLVYREGLNAVRIQGGIAGNVIPPSASVEINYRFAPDKSPDDALAELRRVFDGYEFELLDMSPGARPGLDRPLAQQFVAAVGGEARPKYGWTDVSRFSALGVPAVNYGPADPLVAHADYEYCPAADLERCHTGLIAWLTTTTEREDDR